MKNVAAPATEGLCRDQALSPTNMAEVEFGISTSFLTFLPSSGGHLSVTLASSQTGNSPWQDTSYHMGLFTESKHVIWKQLKADGNDWRQKKRVTEDEMVGWHHWFNEHELGQTLGDGEGQGSLACCSPWGHEESDMTWRLNNNNKSWFCSHSCHIRELAFVSHSRFVKSSHIVVNIYWVPTICRVLCPDFICVISLDLHNNTFRLLSLLSLFYKCWDWDTKVVSCLKSHD